MIFKNWDLCREWHRVIREGFYWQSYALNRILFNRVIFCQKNASSFKVVLFDG